MNHIVNINNAWDTSLLRNRYHECQRVKHLGLIARVASSPPPAKAILFDLDIEEHVNDSFHV